MHPDTLNHRLTIYQNVEEVESSEHARCRGAYDAMEEKNGEEDAKCRSIAKVY